MQKIIPLRVCFFVLNSNKAIQMKKNSILIFLFVALISFNSCNEEKVKLKLIYSTDEPLGDIAKTLKDVLERNDKFEIELIIGEGSFSNLDSLVQESADLTIVENHMPFELGVESLLPLYPQILHIFYTSEEEITDFKTLVYGKKIFIGQEGSGTYRFMKDLFVFFKLDNSKFEITNNPFDNDVYCGFTDIIKPEYLAGFESFKLFSFGDIENYGKGSVAEGISLTYPQVRPFIIPNKTYGKLTHDPILTLATDAVLICRSGIPEDITYQISKTIFRDHQEFTSISPLIYIDMRENFDRDKLNYPLNNGSRIYLDRAEPNIFERYAELAGVLFSVAIALISALISLSKWRGQRKKDRVDVFYKELMDIKNDLPNVNNVQAGVAKIKEIKATQDKAFKMLIDEQLTADESFRIYMELSKETINDVKLRVQQIKKIAELKGK